MSLFSGKKIFILGFVVVLLFAIPMTVFLTQQRQQTASHANAATTLRFTPTSASINVGETKSLDVMMDPSTNLVSFVKLTITYDATKFTVDPSSGFAPNTTAFPQVLQGPTYNSGSIVVSLSVGSDPAKIINSTTKIGTLTLKAISGTNGSTTPVSISASPQTQILSIGTGDQANENVLLGTPAPAAITIGGSSSTTTTTTTNPALSCSSLVLDRSSSGTAPYSVTLTASGKNTAGTIQKVSFTFGDGQTQDVTNSGGVGTNSVNAQISHTYQNAGTYNAFAVLTDNNKVISDSNTCKITITVAAATSGGGSGGAIGGSGTGAGTGSGSTVVVVPTAIPTEIPTVTITAAPTIPVTGPGDKIIGIGAVGIMLSILGGLLLAL